ncbi:MAG: glycosyltransferase family 4 protein [Candidatus Uhrbacteria bacterium]|nr:glycosyltransferase family 4 protein [Candidatus Uhrbacteria bacterium]
MPVHLVTDFYYHPNTLLGHVARIVFGKAVFKRFRQDINVTSHTSVALWALDLAERFSPRNTTIIKLRSFALGRLALSVIRRYDISHAIFYYNSGVSQVFDRTPTDCKVVLFQMHPHPGLVTNIYRNYLLRRPEVAAELTAQEEELAKESNYLDSLASEATRSDQIICTSSFVRRSLLEAGIDDSRIIVAPYGATVSSDLFTYSSLEVNPFTMGFAMRLAFVGQFVVRKGVYELLIVMAARMDIHLTIYTRDIECAQGDIIGWLGQVPVNVALKSVLDDERLWAEARCADFLILPSLAEGFGLVITQAMSVGLPVICSMNSAGPDLIQHGVSGFILDGVMHSDIEDMIELALASSNMWENFRREAASAALQHNWGAFQAKVQNVI